MSCSVQNIGQINLIFYENVLGTNCLILKNEPQALQAASDTEKMLGHSQVWSNRPKILRECFGYQLLHFKW